MVCCANVRNFALENFLFSNVRVKCERLCKVRKNFFNGFAKLKETFFEHCPRVLICARGKNNSTNAINKRRQEFVLKTCIRHDNRANLSDALRVTSCYGNVVLIVNASIIANSVQNILSVIHECCNVRFSRHNFFSFT